MGLFGLKLPKKAQAVLAQANILDNGRTYNTVMQRGANFAPQAPRSAFQQATHNGITNVAGGIAAPAVNLVRADIINPIRMISAQQTNNPLAYRNANIAQGRALGSLGETAQSFARTLPEIATTLGDFSDKGRTYHPGSRIEKKLFGETPVKNIQQIVRDTQRDKGNLAALGVGVGHVLMDTPGLGAAGKLAKPGLKGTVKVTKKIDNASASVVAKRDKDWNHWNQRVSYMQEQAKSAPTAKARTQAKQAAVQMAKNREARFQEIKQSQGVGGLGMNTQRVDGPPRVVAPKTVKQDLAPASPYTGAPKSPGAWKRSWLTVNGVISEHGTGGKEIARRTVEARNQKEIGIEAFLEKVPTVTKLNKNEMTTFAQSLEKLDKGEPINVSPKIQQAIREHQAAIPSVRDRGIGAKLDIGDLGPNYFPRQYKDLFKNDQALGRMAQDMVNSGKATDLGDAIGKLRFMKNEYQKPFGNLEKTREFDLPGYEMTHEAYINYLDRSFDRITKAEQFGPKNEILNQLQGKMQQEGYNAAPGSTVDKYIKIALGDVDKGTTAHKISGKVRTFNALRSLSAAGISNATQLPVNTATIAGFGRTAKGAFKLATSSTARAEAKQTGILLESTLNNLAAQGLGTTNKITRNIASPFFRQIEKFNRQATAIVGKDFGNSLARKAARGNARAEATLREKLGIQGEIGSKLTRTQEIQASRKLVELAQFRVDPMDLPGWVDSPMGKVVAQFRTFGYKQTDFIYNQVLREFMKGNPLPLARFVTIAVPAGTAALAIKGKIKGTDYTEDDESRLSKTSKALAGVGGFGLPGSEGQNLYKSAQYDNLEGGLAGSVGGPSASFGVETAVNLNKAIKGDSTKLKKEAVRSIPAVGPSIANRAFPKKEFITADKSGDTGSNDQREANAKAEKEALKLNAGKGYSLQKLSNGKYAYTIDGDSTVYQSKDQKSARMAIAKAGFKDEEGSYKVIGDKVLRKADDGTVSTMSKDSFDYKLGSATLTSQKRAGDLNGWLKTTESQLTLIEKQLGEPNLDPLDKIALQNQADALMEQAEKYVGYGGFTKGKKGGSGTKGGTATLASVAKRISVKSAPKTYRQASVRTVAIRPRKSGSGKAKISSRKLRVA